MKDLNTKLANFEIKQDNQNEHLEDIVDESEKIKEFAQYFSFNIESATKEKFLFIQKKFMTNSRVLVFIVPKFYRMKVT